MTETYSPHTPVNFDGKTLPAHEMLDQINYDKGGTVTFEDGGVADVRDLALFRSAWSALSAAHLADSPGTESVGKVMYSLVHGRTTLHTFLTDAVARAEAAFKDEPNDSYEQAVNITRWCLASFSDQRWADLTGANLTGVNEGARQHHGDTPSISVQGGDHGDLWRGQVNLGEGDTLSIVITHEGIILDHIHSETGEASSTVAMTFDEWLDFVDEY